MFFLLNAALSSVLPVAETFSLQIAITRMPYAIQLFLVFPWDSGFLPWPVESPDPIPGPDRDIAELEGSGLGMNLAPA